MANGRSPTLYNTPIIPSRKNCHVKNDASVNGLIFSATSAQKLDGGRSSRRIIRVKMRRAGALLARTFPSDYSGTDDSFHGPLLEFSPLPQTG